MNTKANLLCLPNEFVEACNVFNIQPLAALQFYISKITVYSSFMKSNDKLALLAAKIFAQCLEKNCQHCEETDEYKRITGIKYVKELVAIVAGKYSNDKKAMLYKDTVNRWYEAIEAMVPSGIIKTSAGFSVLLTKDYCILYTVFRLTPITFLQHYIDHVSLAKYTHSAKDNPFEYATEFFMQHPAIKEFAGEG